MSVRVIETGDGVGGTWYWNRYPGARVDSPSMQYSLSFDSDMEQEWKWGENYSAQWELEKYANHVADRFDLRRDIQFETTVVGASYDEPTGRWIIKTDRGDAISAKYFITAAGCLSATNVPNFEGIGDYQGTWYHTSRWPREGVDLEGKVVGIIGTGSTGIQAIPVLAEAADHLYVFQRTANFSLPSANRPMDPEFEEEWKKSYADHRQSARESQGGAEVMAFPDRSALDVSDEERNATFEKAWGEHVALLYSFNDIAIDPVANEYAAEFVRNKIRQTVKDPEVAELLCPYDHPIGTKRICIDTNYYETYNRDNITLVSVRENPIKRLTTSGIELEDGTRYDLDVLVFATGFDAVTGPVMRMNIVGKGGLELNKKWEAGPQDLPGYPDDRVSEHVHDHRTGKPLGALQHDDLDRTACRMDHRRHPVHGGQWHRSNGARPAVRGGLGPARQRGGRPDSVPAGQVLVHGSEHSGQAARLHALRRRRRQLPQEVRRGGRQRLRGFRARLAPARGATSDGQVLQPGNRPGG